MIESRTQTAACMIRRTDLGCSGESIAAPTLVFASPNCRIDNAIELARQLGLAAGANFDQLVIGGWRKWGTELAPKLRGAFAFVLWDPVEGCCFAARDHLGLAPLYMNVESDHIAFGQSSQALRAELGRTFDDDSQMLADFVADAWVDARRSFFIGIERFPAAHWGVFRTSGDRREKYWSVADVPRNVDMHDPVGQFRSLFDASVRSSMSGGKCALTLSGGLDSSAIAASAAAMGAASGDKADMFALSLTYRQTRGWNDAPHLAAVVGMAGLTTQEVPADDHDPLQDMEFWLRAVDGPCLPRGHSVSFQLLSMAREMGAEIVLTGHGGDEIVSYGFGRLNELAKAGRWWRMWRETEAASRIYGQDRILLFRRYLTHIKPLRRVIHRLARHDGIAGATDGDFLSADARAAIAPDRYHFRSASGRLDHDERMLHEEVLTTAMQPGSLEVFALCSQAIGVETRMPFYNVELLEHSLSLGSEWKLRDGFSRYILREAFAGDMPEITRKRQDKYDFTAPFIRGLVKAREQVLDLTGARQADRWGLVNQQRLAQARDSLHHDGEAIGRLDAFLLWRVSILAMWNEISRETPQISPMPGMQGGLG